MNIKGWMKRKLMLLPYLSRMNNQMLSLSNQVSVLSEENSDLRNQISILGEESDSLRNQISIFAEETDGLRNQIIILDEENNDLRNQISVLCEETDSLRNQISILNKENNSLRNQISILGEEKNDLRNQISVLGDDNNDLRNQISVLNDDNNDLRNQISVLNDNNNDLRNQISVLNDDNNDLRNQTNLLNEKYNIFTNNLMLKDSFDSNIKEIIYNTDDPVRYTSVYLAISEILNKNIRGSFAEVGVWRGYTANLINLFSARSRRFYLFDTFEGFPEEDLEGEYQISNPEVSGWFKDTSIEIVLATMNNPSNTIIRKGYFPDTAKDIDQNERFSFVMLDADIYKPTKAALEFFSDRMVKGGYIFVHDYNMPNFDWGVKRAVDQFVNERANAVFFLPDMHGSAIIRF